MSLASKVGLDWSTRRIVENIYNNAELRELIRASDNYACVVCDVSTSNSLNSALHVHEFVDHSDIYSYCNFDNRVTVCAPCHRRSHGKKNKSSSVVIFKSAILKRDNRFKLLYDSKYSWVRDMQIEVRKLVLPMMKNLVKFPPPNLPLITKY